MRRHLAASALFAAGLVVMTASAQPPAGGSAPPPKPAEKKAPEKKADGVDAQIEVALATDPDVRMARAKIALAEAELAKARQGVALKVTALRAGIEQQRTAVMLAEAELKATEQIFGGGFERREQLLAARAKIEAAKAALARAEAELKLVIGDGPRAAAPAAQAATALAHLNTQYHYDQFLNSIVEARRHAAGLPAQACTACHADTSAELLKQDWRGCHGILQHVRAAAAQAAPKGPVPDRLRAALDKPVSLGPKGTVVSFPEAVEAFKAAGLDVPVRAQNQLQPVESFGEELPVAAWLQLFADRTAGTQVLVRDYGLLVTREGVPPGAVSVFDFWKQKPVPKGEPQPKK